MKKRYTKKQIQEAIKYWKGRLRRMDESGEYPGDGVPPAVRKAMDEFRNAKGLQFHGTCSFETESSREFEFDARFPDGTPSVRDVFTAAVAKARGQQIDFDPQTYKDFVLVGDFYTGSLDATFALCYDLETAADASFEGGGRGDVVGVVFEDDETPHGFFVWKGEPVSGF